MGEYLDLKRSNEIMADQQAYRQDNITRRGNQVLSPNNPFNNPKRDNYQTYPYDYFAGPDVKIFFGDVWVDDIVTIQFNVNQSKTPIWGYASQNFDAVARGQVIVQGVITIAFKETGYLNVIQSLLEKQRKQSSESIRNALEKYKLKVEHKAAEYIPGLQDMSEGVGVVYTSNGTPQLIRKGETIEQILRSKIVSQSVSSQLYGNDPSSNQYRDFEDFAELLEDTIWGDSNGRPYEVKSRPKLRRPDEFDYTSNGGIKVGRSPYNDVLNILLTFGDINDFRAEHTVAVLNDVHFQSSSMVVSPDGTPIAEQYTFFARDINQSLNTTASINIDPIKFDAGVDNLTISKLEDIAKLEEQLVKENTPQFIKIVGRAALPRGGIWSPLTEDQLSFRLDHDAVINTYDQEIEAAQERFDRYIDGDSARDLRRANEAANTLNTIGNAASSFSFNGYEPLVDQIIKFVELEFNEYKRSTVDTRNSQYIIDVEFISATGTSTGQKITMVLEQTVPETRTYKVISPTRSNYGAANMISREDLFRNIKPYDEFQAELESMRTNLKAQEQQALARAEEYEQELNRLTTDRAGDYEKDIIDRQERIDELYAEEQTGDLSAIEANRLQRLLNEQAQNISEYEILTDSQYTSRDSDLLESRDRAVYNANLQDRDIQLDRADYYETAAGRIGEEQQIMEEDRNQGTLYGVHGALLFGETEEYPAALQTPSIETFQSNVDQLTAELPSTTQQNNLVFADTSFAERGITASENVNINGIQPETSFGILEANTLWNQRADTPIHLTSVRDSTHGVDSLHYDGYAFDVRVRDPDTLQYIMPEDQIPAYVQDLNRRLGNDYYVEYETGDQPHIHVEYDPRTRNTTLY